jgi:hypothetical protein
MAAREPWAVNGLRLLAVEVADALRRAQNAQKLLRTFSNRP